VWLRNQQRLALVKVDFCGGPTEGRSLGARLDGSWFDREPLANESATTFALGPRLKSPRARAGSGRDQR